ncbi:MAG: hypothetical protein U9P14_10685, partial [Gemmatimonadota bacterium]|nr:hypothetical protein [Gemmatimonadota bacterium]
MFFGTLLVCTAVGGSAFSPAMAGELTHNGQLTGWTAWNDGAADEVEGGLRFIPEIRMSGYLPDARELDGLLSLEGYAAEPGGRGNLDLYRAWVRYAGASWELRAGRQKINFGPARMLRTLMWFDRLDLRDPLQLTDGVDGLLYRRYSPDNASLWLWGLYGNGRKGLELYQSDKDEIELGGRYQFPVPRGEVAITGHQRYVDRDSWAAILPIAPPAFDGCEQRLALDGIWDIGPGVWFEAAASKLTVNASGDFWQEYLTVGADYTFD